MIRKQGKRLSLVTFFGKTKKVTRPLADGSFGLQLVLTRYPSNDESHRGTPPVGATQVATAPTHLRQTPP
ncbi:hypothetical protein, partial [Staphylococcus pseudintermedius]|uniref:hypothetical protein n=1 Tax=Staphylococcus pseudintermedius TaxID=283734 RepID=UPI00288B1C47